MTMPCQCPTPQIFSDDPETCHRCGHTARTITTASTRLIGVALAEIMLGHRRHGAWQRRADSIVIFE